MIDLTPKQRFQSENEDTARQFRLMVASNQFHTAVTAALAEYIWRGNPPTPAHLEGAKDFILFLLNIAEIEAPRPTFPKHTLTPPSQLVRERGLMKEKSPEPTK